LNNEEINSLNRKKEATGTAS